MIKFLKLNLRARLNLYAEIDYCLEGENFALNPYPQRLFCKLCAVYQAESQNIFEAETNKANY